MHRRRRIVRAGGIFACSVLALLLWSKLKLVSGIPKTAFATPETQTAGGQASGDRHVPARKTPPSERRAVAPDTN